jgi:hypothetical protein
MPSNSLTQFQTRLEEVGQLLEAHTALVRLQRAIHALANVGGNLANIAGVINHLVTNPGPGRPRQVQALNKAAVALLSGHLQGFVKDIYEESAHALLGGHVRDVTVATNAAPTAGNPNTRNIKKLFSTLGFDEILNGISWQKCSNQTLLKRLNDFNELRNDIVHGESMNVKKATVTSYLSSWRALAVRLDRKLRTEIHAVNGTYPW